MEDFAVVAVHKKSVVLLGLDLIGESNVLLTKSSTPRRNNCGDAATAADFTADDSLWAGAVSVGKKTNGSLIIGDRERTFTVRGHLR